MKKHIICIACPRGCKITAEKTDDRLTIRGNRCPKGLTYARREMEQPMRTVTTTVKTIFPDTPRLPVRLSIEIPLESIRPALESIHRILVKTPVQPGDVLARNIQNSGADVRATGKVGP